MMKEIWRKFASWLPLTTLLLSVAALPLRAQNAETIESLYEKAVEQATAGDNVAASQSFERMFELGGGHDTFFEDYGAQAGGFFFDYGMTLLPQNRWEDAKAAFQISVDAKQHAERVQSPIPGENARERLSKFQLGYCEAQLNDHAAALKLYDEYAASNPPAEELAQLQIAFKLRYGTSLMQVGRRQEGMALIQELFDNRTAWNVAPPFLMQGLFELGQAWAQEALEVGSDPVALAKVANEANAFLDANLDVIHISPVDQFRLGFYDRLRALGFESTRSGLYEVALRYFAILPTIEDIKQDLNLLIARQPVGAAIPAQFTAIQNALSERERAPYPPDAENLRLVATCQEKLGSILGPRAIYWHLAEHYPSLSPEIRSEILHEAARLSSLAGDFSSSQYFTTRFDNMSNENAALVDNVAAFKLQSLFTTGQYDELNQVAEEVRARHPAGHAQREMADALYALSLYTQRKHVEADPVFAAYVKDFPEGNNREIVMFHRANNSLVLGNLRESAEQNEDFLKQYPESARFLDLSLSDLCTARYNLGDYPAAINAANRLEAEVPASPLLARALNIRGDSYLTQSGQLAREQEEEISTLRKSSLESYLAAIDPGKKAQEADPAQAEVHRRGVAESLWKAAEIHYANGDIDQGLALYDAFFPDYENTGWDRQISVFSLPHLEAKERGEEGLTQVEKVILDIGGESAETQNITLLRQAIGSYSEASVRVRGIEATLARLDDFPNLPADNIALHTWLQIQKVIVLQESRQGKPADAPEVASANASIAAVFEELRQLDLRQLSEFALQQIGLHFSASENPFLGVPYFNELLTRSNPEAESFKAAAEMELARIEMRSPEADLIRTARERFRKVIHHYKDPTLIPDAYLNLAKLHLQQKEWREAFEALDVINKQKGYFQKQREKRAEAGFLLGTVLDELDDPTGANQAYLAVVSTYGAFPDWVTQAWERYIPNSLADFEKMDLSTPAAQFEKRRKELALYRLTMRYLYQWQNWTDEQAPSGALRRLRRDIDTMRTDLGITPQEDAVVRQELGLPAAN